MRSVVFFACFLCAGCVITSEYPDDWPKPGVSMNGDCPDISGTYEDVGQGSLDGEWKSLSKTFFQSELASEGPVGIEQPDSESLVVKVTSDGIDSATRSLQRAQNDFWCEDGKLWVSDVDKTLRVWAVARGRDNIGFSKADDGSLLSEFDSKGGGLVFFIPVYGAVTSYFRWRAVE